MLWDFIQEGIRAEMNSADIELPQLAGWGAQTRLFVLAGFITDFLS
jgi:hypothetical protein